MYLKKEEFWDFCTIERCEKCEVKMGVYGDGEPSGTKKVDYIVTEW